MTVDPFYPGAPDLHIEDSTLSPPEYTHRPRQETQGYKRAKEQARIGRSVGFAISGVSAESDRASLELGESFIASRALRGLMEAVAKLDRYLKLVEYSIPREGLSQDHVQHLQEWRTTLKGYVHRINALLEEEPHEANRGEVPQESLDALVGLAATFAPVSFRVRIPEREDQVAATLALEGTGTYGRYKDHVFGLVSRKQLNALKKRKIKFEHVE